MSEQRHAVASGLVTRDVTRNDFDEERLTFDTHGSSNWEIIMDTPPPLSVLSNALKIAYKVTIAMK